MIEPHFDAEEKSGPEIRESRPKGWLRDRHGFEESIV